MKARQLAMLCIGAAPLILTGPAPAEYLGITISPVPNPFGLVVARVYAVFDCPGEDEMLAVFGTRDVPMTLSTEDGFYQHQFGSETAPSEALIAAFPSLAFDTFVTIGVESVGAPDGQPVDETSLLPDWPGLGVGDLTTTSSGWVVPSGSPQADPFNQPNSFAGSGRILIGQFASTGLGIHGRMMLQFRSNGVIEEREIEHSFLFAVCLEITDCIDHPCFGTWDCGGAEGELCKGSPVAFTDCNSNWVDDSCDIDFGTSPDINTNGVPDECECLGDCGDGDGVVGIIDFLALLGVWGQTGVSCDIDGGGVGITDFLALLAAWGPCP